MKMVRFIAEESILDEIKKGNYALASVLLDKASMEDIDESNICTVCNELNGPRELTEDITWTCGECRIEPRNGVGCDQGYSTPRNL